MLALGKQSSAFAPHRKARVMIQPLSLVLGEGEARGSGLNTFNSTSLFLQVGLHIYVGGYMHGCM